MNEEYLDFINSDEWRLKKISEVVEKLVKERKK